MAFYSVNISEIVIFSESPERSTVIHENIIFDDVPKIFQRQGTSVSTGIKIIDRAILSYPRGTSDSFNITDSCRILEVATSSDNVNFSSASTIKRNVNVLCQETLLISDSVGNDNTNYKFNVYSSSEFIINDGIKFITGVYCSDTVEFSNTVSTNLYSAVYDVLNISDNAYGNVTHTVLSSDNVVFFDTNRSTIKVKVSERVLFRDGTGNLRTYGNVSDNIEINDKASLFFRGELICNDRVNFDDNASIIISDYVKRVGDNIHIETNSHCILSSYPRLFENVEFSNESICHKHVSVHIQESIVFEDGAGSAVHFAQALMSMSNVNFNDIASLIISRTTETKFTNALFSNIGTTEQLVYTCPEDNITHILNISLCNILNGATSPLHVSAYILRNGEVDPVFIVKNVEILMGQTFVINNNEMSVNGMNSLDELYIVADTNNSTDFYSAIVEIKQ